MSLSEQGPAKNNCSFMHQLLNTVLVHERLVLPCPSQPNAGTAQIITNARKRRKTGFMAMRVGWD